MSNKRIDLTQFEGITEGYADGAWELNNPQDTNCLVPLVGTIVAFSEANANAVVQLPKLIAELKRSYGRIDELEKEPSVTIDDWDIPSQGPCVTVRYNGCEYVGTLEEWYTSEEE